MNLPKFLSALTILILIAYLIAVGFVITEVKPVAVSVNVPVIINIYKGSGIDKDAANEAVKAASKILEQAGFKLTVIKNNTDVTAGDAGGDSKISPANGFKEFKDIVREGVKELNKAPSKGRGIKIDFVQDPWVGFDTPGWSSHDKPVLVVKNRGTAQSTGETIAHEITHILTLVGPYVIDGTTTADYSGHAPIGAGGSRNGNLMATSDVRTGTYLTPSQIYEMYLHAILRGYCSKQWDETFPAEKVKQQHGTNTGHPITGPEYLGIFSTTLWSTDGTSNIEGQLSLDGLFSGEVNATYALVFDSDNNASTGYSYGGFRGVEYALELTVAGSENAYSINGVVCDLSTNSTQPLPEAPVIDGVELVADEPNATVVLDDLYFKLPKQNIGIDTTLTPISATEIPVSVLTQESSISYDNCSLILDLNQWQDDPALVTYTGVPTPGQNYQYNVSGLEPYSTFDLYVDDRLVQSDTLDASGAFSGGFVFPTDLPNAKMHFLTAQDSTGQFACSITCPKPLTGARACVNPSLVEAHAVGTIFSVNIDVSELDAGWRAVSAQVRLLYDPAYLEVVNVTEGPFLQDPRWNLHGTVFLSDVEVDPIYGPDVLIGDLLLPNSDNGVWDAFPSGNGTIATVTFNVTGQPLGLENPPAHVYLGLGDPFSTLLNDNNDYIPTNLLSGEFRVYPTHIADVNLDAKVDMKDIGLVARAFGAYPGQSRWNASYDVVIDNIINMRDVGVVARNFGWQAS